MRPKVLMGKMGKPAEFGARESTCWIRNESRKQKRAVGPPLFNEGRRCEDMKWNNDLLVISISLAFRMFPCPTALTCHHQSATTILATRTVHLLPLLYLHKRAGMFQASLPSMFTTNHGTCLLPLPSKRIHIHPLFAPALESHAPQKQHRSINRLIFR